MATNSVKINPVKLLGTTYDTLGIISIGYTLKGNKTRLSIQNLDGEISVHPDTDVLSFVYGIGNESSLRNPQGNLSKVVNLSGAELPTTISYAALITLALADANSESEVKFTLA